MVQTVRRTIDIPQLLNPVADVLVVRSYMSCSSRVQTWRDSRAPTVAVY